jgi:FixJ family two-component response regulator
MEADMGFNPMGSPSGHEISPVPQLRQPSSPAELTPVVFIVDPDVAVRESLERLIRCQGWHPETFASAEEFLAHPVEVAPGCLTLDVSLPGLSGLELQKRAAVRRPHLPTIFLSAKGDIPTTVEAMKAGAVEFLIKPFRNEDLVRAIREALERSRLAIVREMQKRTLQRCYASLSLRERQVMALVSSGLLNKRVASELGISEITVKAHRGQVMRKMQAASLPDLVKMAGRLGLSRSRDEMMLRDHAGRGTFPDGQLLQPSPLVAGGVKLPSRVSRPVAMHRTSPESLIDAGDGPLNFRDYPDRGVVHFSCNAGL